MGYCNNCGKPVTEDMDFCPKCGYRLVVDEKGTKVDYIEKKISSQEIKQGKIVLRNEDYQKTREIFADYDRKNFELVTFRGDFPRRHFIYDRRKCEAILACRPFFGGLKAADVIYVQPIDEHRVGIYKDKPTDTVPRTEKKQHTQEKTTSDDHTDIEVIKPRVAEKDVPQQIRNILAKGEVVERKFNVEEYRLYATDRRLIQVKDRNIRDFDYAHISSVAYTLKRYLWLIGIGIPLIILGAVLYSLPVWGLFAWFLIIIGLILIIVGAVHKEEFIEANIVGVSKLTKYKGQRQTLHALLQLIRQKQGAELRVKESTTKDIDSIEAIRKLAELRDQGILTEEEFEQKKKKLL